MFRHVNNFANWYADKGKGIFIKIALVLCYINFFLLPISFLVVAIVLGADGYDWGWLFLICIPFTLALMYFAICFVKGEYVLFKRVNGDDFYSFEEYVKPEKQTKLKKQRIKKVVVEKVVKEKETPEKKVKDKKAKDKKEEVKVEKVEKRVVFVEESIELGDKVALLNGTRVSPLDDTIISADTAGIVSGFSGKKMLVEFDLNGRTRVVSLSSKDVYKYSEEQ